MPLLSLDEAIRSGIRRDRKSPVGSQVMREFTGLRPMEFGAKPLEIISTPSWTGYSGTPNHPMPQLFRGRGVTLLADDTAIYEVAESGGNWTATAVSLNQGNTIYTQNAFERGWRVDYTPTGTGQPWHFIDMYNSWMLVRPGHVIFKTQQCGGQVYACDEVTIGTGCDFRDSRVLLGGFDPTDIYSLADWNAYWATQDENAPSEVQDVLAGLSAGPGGNWVQYGAIGGGDLLWFMSLELMKKGILNRDQLNNGPMVGGTNWTVGANWSFLGSGQGFRHTAGATASLSQAAATISFPLAYNATYRIRFTIANRTAGSVVIQIAAAFTASFSSNGVVDVELITPGSGTLDFEFVPGVSFDGDVLSASVQLQPENSFGDNYFFDLMQRNEFGFTPMPYQGDVACLKPLGDAVIAYGMESSSGKNGGIVALRAHDKYFGQHPPMNLGSGVGVMERGAVGGDETHHLFIDETGELWMMGQDLSCTRLGYQEIFENWIGEQPTITYDPQYDEFWLTSGSIPETYVLNRHGLCKAGQNPTSMFIAQGALVGMLDGATDDAIEIISQPFDSIQVGGTRRDYMVVHAVMLGTTDIDASGWSVVLQYRQNIGDALTDSDAVSLDGRGAAAFGILCYEAQVKLTHPDVTDTNGLDTLQIDIELNGRGGSRHWHDASTPGPAVLP